MPNSKEDATVQSGDTSASTFVYPVKSLLTGKIQPAAEQSVPGPSAPPESTLPAWISPNSDADHNNVFDIDHRQTSRMSATDSPSTSSLEPASTRAGRASSDVEAGTTSQTTDAPLAAPRRRSGSLSQLPGGKEGKLHLSGGYSRKRRGPIEQYRRVPGEDDAGPRKFSTAPHPGTSAQGSGLDWSEGQESMVGSIQNAPLPVVASQALATTTMGMLPVHAPDQMHTATPTHAPQTDYFSNVKWSIRSPSQSPTKENPLDHPTPSTKPSDRNKATEEDLPFNLSQYGIVHLPPLPPSRENSDHSASRSTSRSPFPVSNADSGSNSRLPGKRKKGRRGGPNSSGTGTNSGDHFVTADGQPSSQSPSGSYEDACSRLTVGSSEPIIPVQFQHIEDEDGHHILIGHEGTLEKCEDEPIRTPGACQGFGVLIALDDMEETLVVRQVSENSTELLGLPPSYLFSLECFSDALPDNQVDVLWDNLHFLTEPSSAPDDDRSSPHVFLLSGWGAPGSAVPGDPDAYDGRRTWTCWCAANRADGFSSADSINSGLIVLEFELERDRFNPLYPSPGLPGPASRAGGSEPLFMHGSMSSGSTTPGARSDASTASTSSTTSSAPPTSTATTPGGLEGDEAWLPTAENVNESTTSYSKPIPALERLRRMSKNAIPGSSEPTRGARRRQRPTREPGTGVGMMDVFAVMAQINEQIGAAPDLDAFLKIVVGVIKDLTQFHRVMVYQFDEVWNGQVVSELVDWSQSHDLFRGLHFPASDIPPQARQLYAINKVRLLYDRSLPNARIVCRSTDDLSVPLDMTNCYLRAMSPIHTKYLENMGVRASMSISIMAFDQLWGLVACHAYGDYGMRVSFPVRQILRLLSQSISKHIERLSYASRLHTRKLINTISPEQHPTAHIVSNADDLLGLFDADYGILVIGEGAKIIGPNTHGQEILIMAEYLRLKQFETIQASQSVIKDFPDLTLKTGLEVIAGLLYVPLSRAGRDFIAFLRRGQPKQVNWAGRPLRNGQGQKSLEPRSSFKIWSETVAGRCRVWTDEQLETAGVLALVYGKFIAVWRQKQTAINTNKLAHLILNNASHEVRTPLNHIINYLEMALNGTLDGETRENLSRSHAASKSLLFTINDLLDLTKIESGTETSFHEPFNLHSAIEDATLVYKREAERRGLSFNLELSNSPSTIVGDSKKIRTVVQNLTANALKYTSEGSITVTCAKYEEPEGLRDPNQVVVEIVVSDTGCGIEKSKLESIFREFERVESTYTKPADDIGVGLGLAVVARIVEQLGGQLRVDSTVNEGSKFSFLIPLSLNQALPVADGGHSGGSSLSGSSGRISIAARGSPHLSTGRSSQGSGKSEIDSFVDDLMRPEGALGYPDHGASINVRPSRIDLGSSSAVFTRSPVNSPRVEGGTRSGFFTSPHVSPQIAMEQPSSPFEPPKLRTLIVEDNDVNRIILGKRLSLSGHSVVNTTNGQEGLTMIESDQAFDAVFMDIQMPILNGFEATEQIRKIEPHPGTSSRPSHRLNNGRIPIFAVSASLKEGQREELIRYGMDGWILKPIDFKRMNVILKGVMDPAQRAKDLYFAGCNWEIGGWLTEGTPSGGSAVTAVSALS